MYLSNVQATIPNSCSKGQCSYVAFRADKSPETLSDTFEKTSDSKKDNNLVPKLLLSAIGLGAAIFAFTKLHKTSSINSSEVLQADLKEVQQLYKDIFKRDINADETKDFVKRYKEIINFKTNDNDKEYCEKLIQEICKDRQTKSPKIFRVYNELNEVGPKFSTAGMSTSPDGSYIDIYAFNYKKTQNPAKSYFKSLFHESHHVKQDEIIYRTDKEAFLQKLLDKFVDNGNGEMYKNMVAQNNGDKIKTVQEVKQLLEEQTKNHWAGLEPFEKNSAEYQEGLRLIEGMKNYKFFGDCRNNDEYKNQIIEKGAYKDGELAEKLFDLLQKL